MDDDGPGTPRLRGCGCWAWASAKWERTLNGLPPVVLALYFVQTFMQTFPMTAFQSWTLTELSMTQSQLNDYYALEFLPYCFKPFYAWLSETLPIAGYRRRPYIMLAGLASCCCYVATAFWVRTAWSAFAVAFIRVFCNAFIELLIGVTMIDSVVKNPKNAGAVQAASFGARDLASFAAYGCGLLLYPDCGTGLANRDVFLITAVFPLLLVLLAWWLPEDRVDAAAAPAAAVTEAPPAYHRNIHDEDADDDDVPLLGTEDDSAAVAVAVAPARDGARTMGLPVILIILVVQVVVLWATMQSFFDFDTWLRVLLGLGTGLPLILGVALLVIGQLHGWQLMVQQVTSYPGSVLVAVFMFTSNAVPDAMGVLGTLDYYAFADHRCYLQYHSMVGYACSLLAHVGYGAVLNARNTLRIIFVSTLVAGAASLLALPAVNFHFAHPDDLDGYFWWRSFNAATSAVFGDVAFLAVTVLLSQHCARSSSPTVLYALYLSFLDLGDVTKAILTKYYGPAIVGHDYDDFSMYSKPDDLARYIWWSAGVQSASAGLVLIMVYQRWWARRTARTAAGAKHTGLVNEAGVRLV